MSDNDILKLWVSGGKESSYKNISYYNSSSYRVIQWLGGPKHNIVFDEDGTLTGQGKPTWLTPSYGGNNIPVCTK
jgi:hypothetical protein